MSQKTNRPDYFNLSKYAASAARALAKHLSAGGTVHADAQAALAEGFLVPDPTSLERAGGIFANVARLPGGGSALAEDTLQERIDLLCALSGHLRGLEEAIDLEWSPAWVALITPKARLAIDAIHAFAAAYRIDPAQTLQHLEADWRRHYDEERAQR